MPWSVTSSLAVRSRNAGGGFLMRAILRTGFGGPNVLVIREISEPEPKAGHAVGRMSNGIVRPFDTT